MESVRQSCLAKGILEEITAGWSKGTNTAYQSAWAKWSSWCGGRDLDPVSCGINMFVNFLAQLYVEGFQHRSIKTIRSAISMTHDQIEGIHIGQHPSVSRLMRGIYNSRPPKPVTWDVDKVVSYLRQGGPNGTLSLKQLSMMLAILMALVEASRTSELAALDLRSRVFRLEGVSFTLPTLTKKRSPGAPVFFGGFPQDQRLCVVDCLKQYEDRTKNMRIQDSEGPKKLILSYIKPHKPVTSQRIAHWIKTMLEEAGIDTKTFSAHSTRGASTTSALNQGATISDILRTADWSTESTFRKFYYRPSRDPTLHIRFWLLEQMDLCSDCLVATDHQI